MVLLQTISLNHKVCKLFYSWFCIVGNIKLVVQDGLRVLCVAKENNVSSTTPRGPRNLISGSTYNNLVENDYHDEVFKV